MKFSTLLCLLAIFACGCNSEKLQTKLLIEQQSLKDSANNITDRIGGYLNKGQNDSAEAEKLQLGAVHARLIVIQSSIDSIAKAQ